MFDKIFFSFDLFLEYFFYVEEDIWNLCPIDPSFIPYWSFFIGEIAQDITDKQKRSI